MLNVSGDVASIPPFAVPPSSCSTIVIAAVPFAFAASVYVSVPSAAIAGPAAEQRRVRVARHHERQHLARLIRRTLADVRRPTRHCLSRIVFQAALVPTDRVAGASFTASTLMLNVNGVDVSTPPFAVPPSSLRATVTTAVPNASAASVYVNFPAASIDGCTVNNALLSFVTVNVRV